MDSFNKPEHIPQEDWDAVDSPELDDEYFKHARLAKDVLPPVVYTNWIAFTAARKNEVAAKTHSP